MTLEELDDFIEKFHIEMIALADEQDIAEQKYLDLAAKCKEGSERMRKLVDAREQLAVVVAAVDEATSKI